MWSPSIPPTDLHQCWALAYAIMCGWCLALALAAVAVRIIIRTPKRKRRTG